MQKWSFDLKATQAVKGIAIFLLLFHHLFSDPDKYSLYSWHFANAAGIPYFSLISMYFGKACVAIFLILSGYGLSKSYLKYKMVEKGWKKIRYVCKHLLKLWLNLWVIYICFVPWGGIFGRGFNIIYGENPVKNFLFDIFGLSYLFGTPSMNATWWFFSIIILCYIAFPLFYSVGSKYPLILLAICEIIDLSFIRSDIYRQMPVFTEWFIPFIVGILLAQYNGFEQLYKIINKNKIDSLLFGVVSICTCVLFAKRFGRIWGDSVTAMAVIMIFLVIRPYMKPVLLRGLEFIGKHSANIFMLHTFIYAYYFKKYIFSVKNPLLIFIITLVVCLMLSILIEKIKELIRCGVGLKSKNTKTTNS